MPTDQSKQQLSYVFLCATPFLVFIVVAVRAPRVRACIFYEMMSTGILAIMSLPQRMLTSAQACPQTGPATAMDSSFADFLPVQRCGN